MTPDFAQIRWDEAREKALTSRVKELESALRRTVRHLNKLDDRSRRLRQDLGDLLAKDWKGRDWQPPKRSS